MKNFKRFFSATPRDLGMQALTVEEIAQAMERSTLSPSQLPQGFATTMREIINLDDQLSDANQALEMDWAKPCRFSKGSI